MAQVDTWMIGANAVKTAREAEGAPYIPTLTGNTVADQRQIDELYTSLGGPFDEAVQLFPQLLQQSFSLPVAKSPAGAQINDVLDTDGVKPALRGEQSAPDALETAQQGAEDAIDSL
jgi:ABC-type glycerol-3-phosphate transport system substrate-binding protein